MSGKAGDNLWILSLEDRQVTQVSNETYRLLNGPAWSPDGNYLVGQALHQSTIIGRR